MMGLCCATEVCIFEHIKDEYCQYNKDLGKQYACFRLQTSVWFQGKTYAKLCWKCYKQMSLESYFAYSGSLKGSVSGESFLWATEIGSEKATYHDE